MTFIWHKVVIVLRFYWILTEANRETFLFDVSLPWTESSKYCQRNGKAFFDVMEDQSDAVLKSVLNETNQAWVAATVELSDFIRQPVCIGRSGVQINRVEQYNTNIIVNCLKFCKGYRYIGLMDRDCICVEEASNLTRSMHCKTKCSHDSIHVCGGNESISLYEKVDTHIIQKIAHGSKECVYAQNTNNKTDLFTASCLWHNADGGMCEGGSDTECRNHSWTVLRKGLCRMDLVSPFRWKQTMRFCANIGGQLLSSEIPWSDMINSFTYWLGFHRIATIHWTKGDLQVSKNDTYCALARRVGDIVLIEGEDCLSRHAILCQDSPGEECSESTASWPTSTDNTTETDTTVTYVVIAVSVMLLLAIVIAVLVGTISYRRRKQLQHTEERPTDIQLQVVQEHDETDPGQTPYENRVFVRNELILTVSQFGESSLAQPDYENFVTLRKQSKEDDFHIYDQIISV